MMKLKSLTSVRFVRRAHQRAGKVCLVNRTLFTKHCGIHNCDLQVKLKLLDELNAVQSIGLPIDQLAHFPILRSTE